MNFVYAYDKDEMKIHFGQRDMNRTSTHLGIEKYEGGFVTETVEIYMSVEDAEEFIRQFQESLDRYKERFIRQPRNVKVVEKKPSEADLEKRRETLERARRIVRHPAVKKELEE